LLIATLVALVIILLACFCPTALVACGFVAATVVVAGAALCSSGALGALGRKRGGGGDLTPAQEITVQTVVAAFVNDPASYEDPAQVRAEFEGHEAHVSDILSDPLIAQDHLNRLTGNVSYLMSDEEIRSVIAAKLAEWRRSGVLVTEEEFARLDAAKYHRQLSKHMQPQDTYADVTRIFGAEYLTELFLRDGTADRLRAPQYKLVVKSLALVRAFLTSVVEQFNGREEGLVWRAVDGVLYADKIVGRPAIVEVAKAVEGVVKANPIWGSYARQMVYPKGDYVLTVANSEFSDYGAGVGANALGDNIIAVGDVYYFIDTELKSFRFRFKRSPLNYYLIYRFKALRGLPVFDRLPAIPYETGV
jgi:hypothetical protein